MGEGSNSNMSHAEREKARRDKVAKLIEELRCMVPAPPHQQLLGPDGRPKYIVLLDTIKHITDMRRKAQILKQRIAQTLGQPVQQSGSPFMGSEGNEKLDMEFHSKVIQIASASSSHAAHAGQQRGMQLPMVRVQKVIQNSVCALQVTVAAIPQACTLPDVAYALQSLQLLTTDSKIDSQVTHHGTVLVMSVTAEPRLGFRKGLEDEVRDRIKLAIENRVSTTVDISKLKVGPSIQAQMQQSGNNTPSLTQTQPLAIPQTHFLGLEEDLVLRNSLVNQVGPLQ